MASNTKLTMDMFSPKNLRVLAIDVNVVSLKILVRLLEKCKYKVTSTTKAAEALKILRENRDEFHIVITDVVRCDMDGFKLLEIIGLEMDLPVIMVSGEEKESSIMKGIKHGARDYLLKPVRLQEIQLIWQHVFRKKLLESYDKSIITKEIMEAESMPLKERKIGPEDTEEQTNDQSSAPSPGGKKPRLTWSTELHFKFVDAIQQLEAQGERVHPKRIREVMNVPGLSRENIASHLQKYRSMLKKHRIRMDEEDEFGIDFNRHGRYFPIKYFSGGTFAVAPISKSQPSSSSFIGAQQNFLKRRHQSIFQHNVPSSNMCMQQGMLNHVTANPSSYPLTMRNFLPAPEFKGLKFSASNSSWMLPNEYLGMPSQFFSCQPSSNHMSSLLYPPVASLNSSIQQKNTTTQQGTAGLASTELSATSLLPSITEDEQEVGGSFMNLLGHGDSSFAKHASELPNTGENQALIDIPKDEEDRLFRDDGINEIVSQFNNDGVPRL